MDLIKCNILQEDIDLCFQEKAIEIFYLWLKLEHKEENY